MRRSELALFSAIVLTTLASCGGGQTENCARYVACADHYETAFELEEEIDTADYEVSGSCWFSATSADNCEEFCVKATNDYITALQLAGKEAGACAN